MSLLIGPGTTFIRKGSVFVNMAGHYKYIRKGSVLANKAGYYIY